MMLISLSSILALTPLIKYSVTWTWKASVTSFRRMGMLMILPAIPLVSIFSFCLCFFSCFLISVISIQYSHFPFLYSYIRPKFTWDSLPLFDRWWQWQRSRFPWHCSESSRISLPRPSPRPSRLPPFLPLSLTPSLSISHIPHFFVGMACKNRGSGQWRTSWGR